MNKPDLPPLALIAGPTASGKSALALALAEALAGDGGATIVNADASQLYRDLRILTARPAPEDEARAPHRLYGTRDGADPASAAVWAAEARGAIGEAQAGGRTPILVGGTGLYIRTLLDGIAPVPEIDPAVRDTVRALPVIQAHAALSHEDAPAAARLRPTDTSRVARALEVVRSTGRPLAVWQEARSGGIGGKVVLHPLILLPDRETLRTRTDARFLAMLESGAIEEVAALLTRRLDPGVPVMRAIGVGEIAAWLRGEIDRPAMIAAAQASTRRYLKRQTTWFMRQTPVDWMKVADLDTDLVTKLRTALLTR